MNKYQEYKQKLREAPPQNNPYLDAILRVIMDFEDRVENDNVLTLGVMDIEKLIELVDKVPYYELLEARETPKKPVKKIKFLEIDKRAKLGICACGNTMHEDDNFCSNCGQALDFGRDEEDEDWTTLQP